MPYLITSAQREHITSLTAQERYFHFIDKVIEHGALWTLKKGEELLLFTDDASRMIIPVWPHPDYAQVFATGAWSKAPAVRIDLESFLSRTLPSCIQDEIHFLIFPISEKEGSVSTAKDLEKELTAARSQPTSQRAFGDLPELSDDILKQL